MREKVWEILPQVLACVLLYLLAAPLAWAVPPVNTESIPGVAIRGYDPVAYHVGGAPAAGSEAYSVDWQGAEWRFSSAENKALFEGDPEKYAPAYGGWCAYAVANERTADIDPSAWKIVDDRLYLNYSPGIKARWEADIPGHIEKADANWPGLLAQ